MKTIIVFSIVLMAFSLMDTGDARAQGCRSQTAVPQAQCEALVALYNATDGDNWINNSGWLQDPISQWYGVVVSRGGVTELNLAGNQLAGSLPEEIGQLTSLEALRLNNNSQLAGPLPLSLTNLTALDLFFFNATGLCEPQDRDFQAWLNGVANVQGTRVACGVANEPPVARDDAATTEGATPVAINVLANDTDADGSLDVGSVTIVAAPRNGSTDVGRATGIVTYTANRSFTGTDTFRYTVADDEGAVSNEATVTVTVNEPSTDRLIIAAVEPSRRQTLGRNASATYIITVQDERGAAVENAEVTVVDEVQGETIQADPTNARGQTGYTTTVPDRLSRGLYTLTFTASLRGFTSSDPVVREVEVEYALPAVSFSVRQVNFGEVSLGSTAEQTLTLTNTGEADLEISTIQVEGRTSPFSIKRGGAPGTLAPRGTREIVLRFEPQREGLETGTLQVLSNAVSSPDEVSLSGSGTSAARPGLSLSAARLDFGTVGVGEQAERTVTLTNTGNAGLELTSTTVTSRMFSVVAGLPRTPIPPRGTHEVVVRFVANQVGVQIASLEIVSNAPGSPHTIALQGEGVDAALTMSASRLDFGLVPTGHQVTQAVRFTNQSQANVTLTALDLTGADADLFALTSGGETGVLEPGATREVTVQFAPQQPGAFTAQLEVISDRSGIPHLVALVGEGIAPALTFAPSSIVFDEAIVGHTATGSIQITNAGATDLMVSNMEIAGAEASAFVITEGSPGMLAAGAIMETIVAFTALREGAHEATLRIESDAPGSPYDVALRGTGVVPEIRTEQPDEGLVAGETTGIVVTTSDTFTPTEAILFYRRGGEQTYQQRVLQPNADTFEAAIPPEYVTLRGVDYYVRLSDNTLSVTYPKTNPATDPEHLRVRVEEMEAPGPFAAETYRMVSIPLVLDAEAIAEIFADDFGAYNPAAWRMLRWHPQQDTYAEPPGLDTAISPGLSFWLITASGTGFDTGGGASVDASQPFVFSLQPGWNQIATPFAFPVAWRSISADGAVEAPVGYDGTAYQYDQELLMPWQGYFVYNASGSPVTLTVSPLEAAVSVAKTKPDALLAGTDYALRLVAEEAIHGWRDGQNILGFSDHANVGRDPLDRAEAPGIGSRLRLSLLEGEERLARSLKPAGVDGQIWDIEVAAHEAGDLFRTRKQVTVTLEEHGARPSGFAIYVLDEGDALLPVVEGRFTLTLDDQNPVRRLRVVIGSGAFAEATAGGTLAPQTFDLAPNYPNPFHAATTIRYAVAQPARVVLEVYDVLGRRVRSLVDTIREPGHYEARWDGRDAAGQPVASGVYFYRLQAGTFTASRSMHLVK